MQNLIRRPVALVTCQRMPLVSPDDMALQEALRELGIASVGVPWNDPAVDWRDYAGLVVRSTWDYHEQYAGFSRWLDRIQSLGLCVLNPVATMRWNSDKRYLMQLAQMGANIIPTQLCRGAELGTEIARMNGRPLVIKPVVSGNSWHTVRGVGGSAELQHAVDALPVELSYLVQPYLREIETSGEWSLVFFNGRFSHAVRKVPAAGDYRVQSDFGGVSMPAQPEAAVLADASACLAAVSRAGYGHIYARVDGVVVNGRFQLMEVELIEPNLFLRSHGLAAHRLAEVIATSLAGTQPSISPHHLAPSASG